MWKEGKAQWNILRCTVLGGLSRFKTWLDNSILFRPYRMPFVNSGFRMRIYSVVHEEQGRQVRLKFWPKLLTVNVVQALSRAMNVKRAFELHLEQ